MMTVTTAEKDLPCVFERAASEWRFVAVTIALVLIVTSLPYAYAYLTTPPDKQFMGIMFDVPDHTQYFSWMRELAQAPLASNKLTPEPNAPVFFNLLWWGLGRLGRLLGLGYAAMFQLFRLAASAAFMPVVYWLCAWFFENRRMRRTAFLVALFAAGFGWVLIALKYLLRLNDLPLQWILLVQIVEPNSFFGILSTPHLIGSALYGVSFILVLQGEVKGQLRYAVAAGLFALFIGWQHAYDLILVYGILGGYGLLKWARDQRLPVYLLKSGLIVGALSCSPAIYSVMLTSLDPVWKGVLAQYDNAGVFTPNLLLLPILMGPAFLLALFTALKDNPVRLSGVDDRALFLKTWFWVNFLLIYLPTNYQIKMLNGWQIPIALLATRGLFDDVVPGVEKFVRARRWNWEGDSLRRAAAVALVAVVLPTNLYLWAWRFVDLRRHDYPYYLHADEIAALKWLDGNTHSDDVVLSSLTIGQYVPALTGTRAFLAHWAQTLDFYGKSRMVDEFFAPGTSDHRRQEILQQYSVDYIFYGPAEQALGGYDPGPSPLFESVFTSPSVRVYRVKNAGAEVFVNWPTPSPDSPPIEFVALRL